MIHIKNKKNNLGFTIVELMVAMGLFVIVIAFASGAFIQSLRNQRAMVELIAINDNVSLVLEQIAKEIRLGKTFSRPSESHLKFINAYDEHVAYQLNNGYIEKGISNDGASYDFSPITATNVNIKNLRFKLDAASNKQPKITISIIISGRSQLFSDVEYPLQTTVSPRNLEIP